MARKKKVEIIEEVKEEITEKTNDTDSIDKAHNAIAYKGTVTVKYIDNKGRIHQRSQHNAGQIGLFTCLVRALAGKSITAYVPRALQGYYKDSQNNLISAFNNPVAYRGEAQAYKKDESGQLVSSYDNCQVIEYIFLVPRSQFTSTSQNICTLRLLNNLEEDNDHPYICAQIDLPDDETIPTSLDSNLLIYWQLEFINEKSTNTLTK